ncbi:MAG TPA: hypothetical protein DF383_01105 [Deltaproteobacteria bacterium]|nr:hypothetical protein [Deltaproteobacteria bacterium]
MQQFLTQLMNKIGGIVEKFAAAVMPGKAPKRRKTGVVDAEGEDFGTIQWDEKQLESLLGGAERKELFPLLPSLTGKRCLYLSPGRENDSELLVRRGATAIFELDVGRNGVTVKGFKPNGIPKIRGTVDHLPFAAASFDFILYPSALAWRSDLPTLIPEAARCLKDNGRLLLSTIHPFFEYLMNPRYGFQKNIDTLFSTMKKNGFFIEDLKEGGLEEAMHTASLSLQLTQELQGFRKLPVILAIKGLKLAKRKSP